MRKHGVENDDCDEGSGPSGADRGTGSRSCGRPGPGASTPRVGPQTWSHVLLLRVRVRVRVALQNCIVSAGETDTGEAACCEG